MTGSAQSLNGSKMPYVFLYVGNLGLSRLFFEKKLGLQVVEEDADSVKYDAGGVMLALNKATDHGVPVDSTPDDTSVIVFHTDDIDALRASLEQRGVEFSGNTVRYDIGATATFYDPDGHCFGLFEPSAQSLQWPSAKYLRRVLAQKRATAAKAQPLTLGTTSLVYLFLFVRDAAEACDFYQNLGLPVIEQARDGSVAKFDAGGVMLAVHLVASDPDARAKPEDLLKPRRLAPVFSVPDVESAVEALAKQNVMAAARPIRSQVGVVARFEDPSRHVFYLYEPSAEALRWPSGEMLQSILSSPA